MKLALTQNYNPRNIQGLPVEILNIKRDPKFSSGFGVLTQLNGLQEPVWLTIDWVLPIPQVCPTKRASDGLESPAKKKPSTAGKKSPAKKRKVTSRA